MEDNLFQNIKDRFEQSNNDLGWNNPRKDLFEAAMFETEKKKKSLSSLFLLIPVLIIIVFAVTLSFSSTEKDKAVSENSNHVFSQIASSSFPETTDKRSFQKVKKETSIVVTQEPFSSETANDIKSNNTLVETSGHNNHSISKNTSSTIIGRSINYADAILSASLGVSTRDGIISLDKLPSISASSLISLNTELPLLNNIPVFSIAKSPRDKSKFRPDFLYLTSGINFSNMDMIGDGNPAFELTGYENFSKGIDLTLGLGFELGHNFSMTGIFGFSRFYNSSTYSSHQDIHSSNFVHNTDGSMNYSFRELMTPVGTLDPEMEESIPMPDNGERDMYQWADINQYLNVLRLGVGLEYALLRNQKFNLSLGAHFATNKILCSSTTAYLYLKDDSDHMMADTEYRANMAHGLRNLYYSGALEISAQYLLSDNFAFRFGVSRSSSLSNLLTSPTTNTSLNYYSSNLGFVATF